MFRERVHERPYGSLDLDVGAYYEERALADCLVREYDADALPGEGYRDRMRRSSELLQGATGISSTSDATRARCSGTCETATPERSP